MTDKSAIEWTDFTWSPVRPEVLAQPLRWKKPRRIFVNSMSDLFHPDVPDEYIAAVFGVMAACPQHSFQVLTNQPGRMRRLLSDVLWLDTLIDAIADREMRDNGDCTIWPSTEHGAVILQLRGCIPWVWLGVSVEDQKTADERIPLLLETPAVVRFVSMEPLLGPVDLGNIQNVRFDALAPTGAGGTRIDWLIVGGESGPGARPMHPDWARSIRDQCAAAGVPFLFKQWGEWASMVVSPLVTGRVMLIGGDTVMRRIGKKAAGRELDGRTWDEFPEGV